MPRTVNPQAGERLMSNMATAHRPRTLLFGMPGALFTPVLMMLEYLQVPICGIVTPAPAGAQADITTQRWLPRGSMMHLHSSQAATIPHVQVRTMRSPEVIESLTALNPDLIVVSCFPWLIPSGLYRMATWLALNVHPALLPAHRGPDPLFWTFHDGDHRTGVTIHELDETFDTGPVLLQSDVPLSAETSYGELEQQLGRIGAELLAGPLMDYPTRPKPFLPTTTFPSYESHATTEDLLIEPGWTVDRARRFICGVAESHGPLRYQVRSGRSLRIVGLGTPSDGSEILLRNGTLRVRTASTGHPLPSTGVDGSAVGMA